jgi:hypothetical protein
MALGQSCWVGEVFAVSYHLVSISCAGVGGGGGWGAGGAKALAGAAAALGGGCSPAPAAAGGGAVCCHCCHCCHCCAASGTGCAGSGTGCAGTGGGRHWPTGGCGRCAGATGAGGAGGVTTPACGLWSLSCERVASDCSDSSNSKQYLHTPVCNRALRCESCMLAHLCKTRHRLLCKCSNALG